MNEIEKVLYALRCRTIDAPSTCAECSYYNAKCYGCNVKYIMKDALDLLEGQENGVEPKISRQEDGSIWCYCGKCGYMIERGYQNYCSVCGTKIKGKKEND